MGPVGDLIETNHIFFGPSPFILRHLLGFQWCPTMNTLRQNHRELVHMRYYFDKGRAIDSQMFDLFASKDLDDSEFSSDSFEAREWCNWRFGYL